MRVDVKTKNSIDKVTITNLDKELLPKLGTIFIGDNWHKLLIPCNRHNIIDITISGESIKHCLNSGKESEQGYEIWLHGNLAQYFARISECIAQDDLLRFKNLNSKYLLTESWNEKVEGDFLPNHVKQFFACGEGPHWYHKSDFSNLPYIEYNGPDIDTNIDLQQDLQFIDTKFHGQGQCRSLQRQPVLPMIDVENIKDSKLKETMKQFGFSDVLQMQYVELQPNSVIPLHRDDFYYEDGRYIINGPTQLYFVLAGDKEDIKFKFKNVGLLDVSKPIFINNHKFVHSLVYTGSEPRGVLLAYGISKLTNKNFVK
jgi:hypothetical protein